MAALTIRMLPRSFGPSAMKPTHVMLQQHQRGSQPWLLQRRTFMLTSPCYRKAPRSPRVGHSPAPKLRASNPGPAHSPPPGQKPPNAPKISPAKGDRKLVAQKLVGSIIAACVLITSYHTMIHQEFTVGPKKGDPTRLLKFDETMVQSLNNVQEGRSYTMVTALFTHKSISHLGVNMFALWTTGVPLATVFGPTTFAIIYFGSGLLGSYFTLQHQKSRHDSNENSLGASGDIMGVIAWLACAKPNAMVQLLGIIPTTMKNLVITTALGSLACEYNGWVPGIAHSSHLGGMLFGCVSYFYMARRGLVIRR